MNTKPGIPKPAENATRASTSAQAGRQIARAASVVMAAYIISNLVGVVRGMVITQAFGTSAQLDAFNAANRVTELLFNLMAGGALGSAFIPLFTGFLTRKDKQGAWTLASGVLNVVLLVLVAVSILVWIFAPELVRYGLFVLVPTSDSLQIDLTVRLLRLMLPTVAIFGVSGLVMGMLNAHQVFLWPALAPAMYSLGMILGTLFLPTSWGIDRLAIGVVLGAAGHLLLQLPSLFRIPDRHYTLKAGIKVESVRKVLWLMIPRMIGAGVVQLNFVANTIIALSLGEGAASAVSLAFALMLMPQAVIAQSAGTAALPTLSAQVELGQTDDFRKTLSGITRAVVLLSLPAALGLILLRFPLVQVLYERGNFDSYSTQMVAWALLWYAAGLVGHCLVEVLSRAFYALHDTRTPVVVGVIAMSFNILMSFVFTTWFRSLGWMAHGGLALANSLATGLESVALLLIMRKRLGRLEGKSILRGSLAGLAGSILMALSIWLLLRWGSDLRPLWLLSLGFVGGAAVYALSIWLFKVSELREIVWKIHSILSRFR